MDFGVPVLAKCATESQKSCWCAIREAAKISGLWEKAPYLNDVPVQALGKFYQTVLSMCPKLQPARKMLRKRLSDALMNRRAHLRSLGIILPKKKRVRREFLPRQQTRGSKKSNSNHSSDAVSKSEDSSIHGSQVHIMSGEDIVGIGLVIPPSDPSCLFAEVILKSKSKDIEEINLYEPVGDKFLFNDLKVADTFKWKTSNLILKKTKQRVSDLIQAQGIESDEDDDYEDENFYEKRRMNNIMANKKVLQEIMDEGINKMDCCSTKQSSSLMKTTDSNYNDIDVQSNIPKEISDSTIETSIDFMENNFSNEQPIDSLKSIHTYGQKKENSQATSRPIQKKRSSKFWDYVDSDDEEFEKDAFEPVVLTNKRSRKPSQKLE